MNIVKFRNNKLLFCIVLSTILFSLSFVNLPMAVFSMLAVTVMIFTSNLEDGFCLFLYSLSFGKSFYLFRTFYFYSFVCVLFFVIKAFKLSYKDKWQSKSRKFKWIVSICLLYLFVQPIVTIFISFKKSNLADLATLFTFLLLFVFVYFISGKLKVKKMILAFAFGIVVSSLIAVVGHYTNYIDYSRIFMKDKTYYRFSGLTPHPNSFSRNCILAIALLLYSAYKSQNKLKYYSLIVVIALFGALSYSKAYIIMGVVALIYAFALSFIQAKSKSSWFKGLLILLTLLAIIIMFAIPYWDTIIDRFWLYGEDASWINNITTGRVDVWRKFLNVLKSSPVYLIFGKSMMGVLPCKNGIHSTYLALFYQYGIVGVVMLLIFLFFILKNLKNHTPLSYLPLLLMLFSAFSEDHIFIHTGYLYFGIALLTLSADKVKDKSLIKEGENTFFGAPLINCISKYVYLFFKRFLDIIISFVGLIVAFIPMLIVAILVKATSKGPVFFKDKRIGKNGKTITVLKFRSMYIDAESRIEQLLTKEQYEMWKRERKVDNDPRITKIGKIIRKTSLDELPQLLNILKGDLSIVGNRPVSKMEYETHFSEEEQKRLDVMRPGLTGYWQVYGRSGVEFSGGERQKMYLHYSDKASFWLDIKIFIKTFFVVLFGKGAK